MIAGIGALALLAHAALYRRRWADDAFITFRYARNLLNGEGLVFNPGERVEGLTNLGWALLLTPVAERDPLSWASGLGLVAALGCVVLLARWCRAQALGLPETAAAMGVLTLAPWLPYWSGMGLETAALALVVTAAWTRYPLEAQGRGWPMAGLAMGLAPWLRPDGALAAVVVGARHLLAPAGPRFGRRAAGAAAVVAGLAAALVGLKLVWFGAILPNTFHAKVPEGAWREGLRYLGAVGGVAPLFTALATAAVLVSWRRLPAWIALAWAGMAVAVGGDIMANARLLVPAWPAVAACVALGVSRVPWRWTATALALLTMVPLTATDELLALREAEGAGISGVQRSTKSMDTASLAPGLRGDWAFPAAWMLAHAPDDATLAFTELGLFGYVNDQRVIDPLGLTDPVMAGRGGEGVLARWRSFSDRVDLLAVDVAGGWWRRHVGYLRAEGWLALDGCEGLWVFARGPEPPAPVPPARVAERLEALARRAPRMATLRLAVEQELRRDPTCGGDGRRVDPAVLADPARWPLPEAGPGGLQPGEEPRGAADGAERPADGAERPAPAHPDALPASCAEAQDAAARAWRGVARVWRTRGQEDGVRAARRAEAAAVGGTPLPAADEALALARAEGVAVPESEAARAQTEHVARLCPLSAPAPR
ncbi:MAG: hypothetical protein H6739_11735 [Alphaproteobacteria bacterium]|nr:hypothetical protein [Alphaproteobacteria bacterium]